MKTTDRILYLCEDEKKIIYVDGVEPAPEKWQGDFYPYDYYSEILIKKRDKSFDVIGQEMANAKVIFKTLKGFPKEITGDFICSGDEIQSFEGGPKKVNGDFRADRYTKLKSLKYGPKEVGKIVELKETLLKSLEGAPEKVGGSFFIESDYLTSLKGAPKEIGGSFNCEGCPKISKEEIIKYSKEHPDIWVYSQHGDFKDGKKIFRISPNSAADESDVIYVSKKHSDTLVQSKYGNFINGEKVD